MKNPPGEADLSRAKLLFESLQAGFNLGQRGF
jgi:hypothetical protein